MDSTEVIRLAREANIFINELHCAPPILNFSCNEEQIKAFAKLVAEHERWKCAQLCEDWDTDEAFVANIAEAIRARSGEKE